MSTDLKRFERRVSVLVVFGIGLLIGLDVAVHSYSGPSIALGFTIAIGVAVAIALLSLRCGERFGLFFAHCLRVFF